MAQLAYANFFSHKKMQGKFQGFAAQSRIHGNWPETECYPVINLSFWGMGKDIGNTDVRPFEATHVLHDGRGL